MQAMLDKKNYDLRAELENCTEFGDVDSIFDKYGYAISNTSERLRMLNEIMRVHRVFYSDEDVSLEDKYAAAKEELASQIWNRLGKPSTISDLY